MDISKTRLYLRLLQAASIGSKTALKMIKALGNIENVFQSSPRNISERCGLPTKMIEKILKPEEKTWIDKQINLCLKEQIDIVCYEEEFYPPLLREIDSPPLLLFIKGKIPNHWQNAIALVGTRNPTPYGIQTARKLAYQIAYAGFAVISGFALGIDTQAHLGALAANGTTWAVLGSGIDHCYPAQNFELSERISAQGLLISEFPMGTAPTRFTFPLRNRIISGLSVGVVIVEAAQGSGALLTAQLALEQGRLVFAVPGRIDNPYSFGPHQLIKQGAKLVDQLQDILDEIHYLHPKVKVDLKKVNKKDQTPIAIELSKDERLVYEALNDNEMSIDELAEKTELALSVLCPLLIRLEMKKIVQQLPGNRYAKI
ncbi:DNA-protecting protein DprA [Candidatus Methylacidiphilum infernorum]|uniref:DNA-protecting protein DprA n=1 Tax=Candidatus Methylacidiphilum infernorum TaxID=511746 RepID=A0ABX7PUJ1_9BACT|nr:DNA-processing protein DprA [Candidatus Methylacidiphilum infernorum]QSR86660.1 DNA-protecting protein DprA [Candidatus Methylacidiphilum infernorum]